MNIPSNNLACRTLFLQAANDGRGQALFGEDWKRTCEAVLPFVEGVPFPSLYLEFPLAGEPFLDVTVLYMKIESGTRFSSEAAAGMERVIDWYADVCPQYDSICFGFEVDGKSGVSAPAAVHFQHRRHIHLAEAFCEALGETQPGRLYMNQAARMPEGWPLAFFGMFRGRPGSPLRICGYLDDGERQRCAGNPSRLAEVFRQVGFQAYDDGMLRQAAAFLDVAREGADFQFDVYPDGSIGDTFSFDIHLGLKQSEKQRASFTDGLCAEVMRMLVSEGAADDRWQLASGMCFSYALPVEDENGMVKPYALIVCPQWVKARWRGGVLQTAKLYSEGQAGIIP